MWGRKLPQVTKLLLNRADTPHMRAGLIEPRTAMWARAEINGIDPAGTPIASAAILEDTSSSGACLRLPKPVPVGAKLIIKWRKEEFCAIARNCRQEGTEFLLGVQRDSHSSAAAPGGCRAGVPPALLAGEQKRTETESPLSAAAVQLPTDNPAVA